MANSIGSLYIDITARTASLEQDMAKVKNHLTSLRGETEKAGKAAQSAFKDFRLFNSFEGRGMTGITLDMMAFTMALQMVKKEIMYVIDNIDKIPGIPAEARSSVNEFKINLKEMRNEIDAFIARGLGAMFQGFKMVGAGFGSLVYGQDAMTESLQATLESLDKLAEANDPTYWDKVRAAQTRLSEAKKAEAVASSSLASQYNILKTQAKEYQTFAESGSITALQAVEAQIKSFEKLTQAARIKTNLEKELLQLQVRQFSVEEQMSLDKLSQRDRIHELNRLIIEDEQAIAVAMMAPADNLRALQDWIDNYKRLTEHTRALKTELKSLSTPTMELSKAFVSGFSQASDALTDFVTGGEAKLTDFLKVITDRIISTFFSLAVVNPIINSLFGGVTGMSILPAFFGMPAMAVGGPFVGGQPFIAGENGPELINVGSSGSVLTAQQTAGMLGKGGRGGDVYNIDARGADAGQLVRLESMIKSMNATIERRSLAANANERRRETAMGQLLSR